MNVRLVQLDGKYPNLALMKLAHYHRANGDHVHLTRRIHPGLFESRYDLVYASAIFDFSAAAVSACRREWPQAIIGGTGSGKVPSLDRVHPARLPDGEK